MPDFSAAISLLKKPIEDIYEVSADHIKNKILLLKTNNKMKELHKKLYETQKVKTIWKTERPISLNSFFYPVNIKGTQIGQNNSVKLNSLNDISHKHNIIYGTVGQGKSILLRYLLGKEIKSGTRIPLFIELRNVDKGCLFDSLVEKFSDLIGLDIDNEIFNIFAYNGKISFFLDGFDEIDPVLIQNITKEIDVLSGKYTNCKILLTSRPDSECKFLTNFYEHNIIPLGLNDLLEFYRKITKDDSFSSKLVGAIVKSPTGIKELVTTPLLATLLAISYRSTNKIPLDFSDFYDELFQILLIKHDASKLGWTRKRKSKIDDRQLQNIFEAFCFLTRRKKILSIDKDYAYKAAEESMRIAGVQSDSHSFLDDIKKITCLIADEGKNISFVHSSVQEFFASKYIKNSTDVKAKKFYDQIIDNKWQSWLEEIRFLSQIDSYRSVKYFFYPDLCNSIQYLNINDNYVDRDSIVNYLKELFVIKKDLSELKKKIYKYFIDNRRAYKSYHLKKLDEYVYKLLFSNSSKDFYLWSYGFKSNPSCNERSYYEISIDKGGDFKNLFIDQIIQFLIKYCEDVENMKIYLARQEDDSEFLDLTD